MERRSVDMSTYKRKAHFDYFRTLAYPHVGVTADVDVTNLITFCKEKGYSFYLSFMHAAALAADSIGEFRQRICGDGIVEYDECGTSHTESVGDGTYCYCTLYHHMPFREYIRYAEAERQQCREKNSIEEDENVEGLYFISTLPWIPYSAIIQPTAGREDSNPRITWGKYQKDYAGRLMLPVTVLCHHALVDGIHLSRFYTNLDTEIHKIIEQSDF
ncbi:CatA-like O-acetyltransferase [Acetivibrio mesophilus]|jgi:chloramphenicol O-acetyltransferase type A|uniref:Chloramphenicol acetyltransferase n=1 Tax=Acetivibrio mesophilus TaxID=2487273 RepID=A0A4Q0I8Q6_9FIRM|nr:CatA-like O-acetyltransferase [Acetivibrio mesophilus]RXE60397.1 chloramphenicol acetyltransferase [Acetivibrio mesophilus]